MPCEVKTDQTAKLITLLCAHDLTADIFKADTVGIGTVFAYSSKNSKSSDMA